MFAHFVVRSAEDFARSRSATRLRGRPRRPTDDDHLAAAVHWLMRSIETCGGRASSKGYQFIKGWLPPYPETSGYIIPTLLMLGRENAASTKYRRRAEAIADWLIGIQMANGGFRGRELGVLEEPDVFDTGMILLGFNTLIHEGAGDPIREAGRRAAEFLVSSVDQTGCFVRHLSNGILHTYNVRSAWGLVAYGTLVNESRFIEAGLANARWACAQQIGTGYFHNNAFKPGGNANTHGTAYVLRGLLQIHELTKEPGLMDSVILAAEALQARYHEREWIAAELGPELDYLSGHICLTGYAQLAIIFFRLFQMTGDVRYRRTGERLVDDVARSQDLDAPSAAPHFGAIAGSFPIYGRYAPLQYPNWATKFFIDALIAKKQVDRGERDRPALQLFGG